MAFLNTKHPGRNYLRQDNTSYHEEWATSYHLWLLARYAAQYLCKVVVVVSIFIDVEDAHTTKTTFHRVDSSLNRSQEVLNSLNATNDKELDWEGSEGFAAFS
jgi:hypothetical protein